MTHERFRPVLDFTSALYLGLRHGSELLPLWPQFTLGKPAALEEPAEARQVAQALAQLQGVEAAVLASSTLHLAWDLFVLLNDIQPITILMDAEAYPILRWGVERAACRGAPLRRFPHHSPSALRHAIAGADRRKRRPVIVTDGFCPGCGRLAPLRDYLACAEAAAGLLVIDDTQALGILGHSPDAALSYGYGGGGSLPHCGIRSSRVLTLSSLAKALGVPLAVLAGSAKMISAFADGSKTRVHCSPPSFPVLAAARHALSVNRRCGDALRALLLKRVRRFLARLRDADLSTVGGHFPIQSLDMSASIDPVRLHRDLLQQGLKAVLQRTHTPGAGAARLTFLLTARHQPEEIDCAAAALTRSILGAWQAGADRPDRRAQRNDTPE